MRHVQTRLAASWRSVRGETYGILAAAMVDACLSLLLRARGRFKYLYLGGRRAAAGGVNLVNLITCALNVTFSTSPPTSSLA